MDFFAIATLGFFPTPTPTNSERYAFAASWGYLSVAGTPIAGGSFRKGLFSFGYAMTTS